MTVLQYGTNVGASLCFSGWLSTIFDEDSDGTTLGIGEGIELGFKDRSFGGWNIGNRLGILTIVQYDINTGIS